jgi:TRAP-type transport system periplasmic protein
MQNIRLAYVAAAIGAATMPAAAQQEITLTVAAGQPLRAMNPLNLVSEFYIPEVNKRIEAAGLDIKIDWKEAYAGSLLKPTFVLQGVSDGIADIGFEPTIFHPDKLPLEQVSFMTPFTTTDVELVGKTIDKLHSPPSTTSSVSSVSAARLSIPMSCSPQRRCRNSRTSTA